MRAGRTGSQEGSPLWLRIRSPRKRSTVVSIVVGRLHEGMDLPDLVQRQPQTERRHLRSLAALDHRLQKALVAELRREEIRPPRAGAVVADVALARVRDPAGGDGVRL